MSTIGGPGGIGGPNGPGGPSGPAGADGADGADGPTGPDRADHVDGPDRVALDNVGAATATRSAGGLDALAADIAAGRLTAHEAVEKLIDDIAGTQQLGTAERAELRELLTDLVANDPYLKSLM